MRSALGLTEKENDMAELANLNPPVNLTALLPSWEVSL
jgi:hypothetical protein